VTLPQLALDIPALADAPQALPVHGTWVLGSDPDRADLCLPDPEIEGVHCVLDLAKDGSVQVRDLGSLAGTKLNGTPIQAAAMQPGDHLDLGGLRVWLVDLNQGEAAQGLPKVAGFQILSELGRGEGGTVYLAIQESLARRVALKILSPQLAHDPEVVSQFQREARAAAALGHTNVVTVFDVGSDGPIHYLCMEHMAGGSLADRLQTQGRQGWEQVLGILRDAASALQFAESRGLVHRDIKPANLMVTEAGVTKLADLGLVLDVRQSEGRGPLMGTPHFLAPELIRGEAPSPQSDLYSLGASAFQLLTGRTPFQGGQTKQILREVVHGTAPSVHELQPEVPLGLSVLVGDLMAKDPAARPQGAASLLQRLQVLQQSLLQDSSPVRASSKRTWMVSLVALIALLAVAWFAWRSPHSNPERPHPLEGPSATASTGSQSVVRGPSESALIFEQPVDNGEPETVATGELESEFEVEAQTAMQALAEQSMAEPDRIQQLRDLATKYQGSSAADEALVQAGALEESIRALQRSEAERDQQLAAERNRLRDEFRWDPTQGDLADVIAAVLAFEPIVAPESVAAIEQARIERVIELLQQADSWLSERLKAVEGQLSAGAFGPARQALKELRVRFAKSRDVVLPASLLQGGAEQAKLEWDARVAEIDVVLDSLPERWTVWSRNLERLDRERFGSLLGRGSGLLPLLQDMDFEAARKRLQEAQGQLQTEAARGWVAGLLRDLDSIVLVQRALIEEYQASHWKRNTTLDPRSERPQNVTITAITPQYVSLDGDRVAWGAFRASALVLRTLWEDRMPRAWSPEESEGMASLYRLQAVLAYLDQVGEMLVEGSESRFTDGEKRKALEWLESARAGQTSAGLVRLERELRVALPLAQGLRCLSDGQPGSAAGYLERAIELGHGTWILALLTDGSQLHFPIPDPMLAAVEPMVPKEVSPAPEPEAVPPPSVAQPQDE